MVLEGIDSYVLLGKPVAAEDMKVKCYRCGEVGHIALTGSRPAWAPDNIMGHRLALTNDLVICGCSVHPKLIHSSTQWCIG